VFGDALSSEEFVPSHLVWRWAREGGRLRWPL